MYPHLNALISVKLTDFSITPPKKTTFGSNPNKNLTIKKQGASPASTTSSMIHLPCFLFAVSREETAAGSVDIVEIRYRTDHSVEVRGAGVGAAGSSTVSSPRTVRRPRSQDWLRETGGWHLKVRGGDVDMTHVGGW